MCRLIRVLAINSGIVSGAADPFGTVNTVATGTAIV